MEENKTRKPVKLGTLRKMHQEGEPIVMLTCYDASFAALEDEAGVDIMLIGDSLGMTIQGHGTTIPVSIDDMAYHTACVARGNKNAFVLADMNFGSYLVNEDEAVRNAVKLMKAGANMVKFEGGLEVWSARSPLKADWYSGLRAHRFYASVGQRDRRILCAGQNRKRRRKALSGSDGASGSGRGHGAL